MARSKNNKATAASRVAVDVGSTGTRSASKLEVTLLILSIGAAIWAVAMMTTPGKVGYVYFFYYLDFYIGVVSLVSLSITIMVGLVATDRLVLSVRQRVLLQSAHRTTGVIAVAALVAHVWTKFAKDYIGLVDIFIPFLTDGLNKWFVGLGPIAGWIMVLVLWSGIARARFIGRGKPWMWRGIHAISYLMWPIALTHGLSAGRPAATWVTVSYIVCVLGVLVGLAVRLSVSLNRRKDFASPAGVGAVKPSETGTLVPTAPAPIRRPARREAPPVDLLAPAGAPDGGAPTQTWNQPPPTRPVSPAPAPAPVEEDYPPRGRRQAELEAPPAPRQRRPAEDDERYDTQTRMSRRDVEEERYRYDEEPAPRSRGSRSQEVYDEGPRGRGRRYEDDERYDTQTRMSRRDVESTSTRMRRDDVEATGTRMRREPEYDEPRSRRRDDVEATGTRMRREPEYDDRSRGRRRADDDYDAAPRGSRSARYEEPRYEEPPRRQSRSEFVDLAEGSGGGYPADDSATLVDTGSRRARRDEPGRGGGRRGGRDDADDAYLSQLRGDAREAN
ncbi:hypothetical protein GCM10010112_59160 [Actinoplanes lobatus]|uniref:DMSO/TMAO reductase YedYZ heme-binding membrane subunit n=1 Tax=Actinoplanes lobatus TaxID=113568 RepID=A0A7W7HQA3_9ACTN|nr:translation initiation factor III [Actinoplanes lobatus]MBB4754733.1 hypothetical protein [Actinoplanes lobatus]GGN82055.1 hypothetical protein GCM10010112_59160 [Actinoplanes lobatus]GIE43135.1 hypothetical protein Alo02nite_60330 [Actinoplanes lobatus]